MPVPFDLTSTRALEVYRTLTQGMVGGRLGGRQGGGPLDHLIGRQSFLIGSQEIYRNEPRWRIVMTWPRAREVDLERDIRDCMSVYVSIHRRLGLYACWYTTESSYQMELLLTTVTKPGLKITCSIRKDDTPRNMPVSIAPIKG